MTSTKTGHNRRPLAPRRGFVQWQYDGDESSALRRSLFGGSPASALVGQWEFENRGPVTRFIHGVLNFVRNHAGKVFGLALTFILGAALASGPDSTAANLQLRERLRRMDSRLKARQGELELVRLELGRLNAVITHSKEHKIPADLAASIYDIAIAEGIDPKIAFGLVDVESEFSRKAVSPKGAVGLTQVMPATARILQPGITYSDLFDRDTNLRLGFRYLRDMIAYYDGDLELALTAYNRGPGTVDKIRRKGGDPSNGYSTAVIKGRR